MKLIVFFVSNLAFSASLHTVTVEGKVSHLDKNQICLSKGTSKTCFRRNEETERYSKAGKFHSAIVLKKYLIEGK